MPVGQTGRVESVLGRFVSTYRKSQSTLVLVSSAKITRHDDDRVAEVHSPTMTVGKPSIIEYLQHAVIDVRVRLLYLVKQNHRVRDGGVLLPSTGPHRRNPRNLAVRLSCEKSSDALRIRTCPDGSCGSGRQT